MRLLKKFQMRGRRAALIRGPVRCSCSSDAPKPRTRAGQACRSLWTTQAYGIRYVEEAEGRELSRWTFTTVSLCDDDLMPGNLEKNDHQDRNNQEGDDDSQPIPADEEAIQTLGNLMDLIIRQLGQPRLYFISGE